MKHLFVFLLFCIASHRAAMAQKPIPQQSLNQYVEFLNQSAQILISRFDMLLDYQADVNRYRKEPALMLQLPSSGPLEAFYYQKALSGNGLRPAEKQQLDAATKAIWNLLTQLDETAKSLETHVRLKAYGNDGLKQSDKYIALMQSDFVQFGNEKEKLYKQIQQIYMQYQPDVPADPYHTTWKTMEKVLGSQTQLLDSLPYYLNQNKRYGWPAERIKQSILEDEKLLEAIGNTKSKLNYPASDALMDFKSALLSMQDIKRRSLDDYTFAAQQSVKHGNEVYRSLLKQYNQDLLATHQSFVNYSQPVRRLLHHPAFSPRISGEPPTSAAPVIATTKPFQDKLPQTLNFTLATSPASEATVRTLNAYVRFINESLRQMHLLQILLRNYQSSAEYYRGRTDVQRGAGLTYSYDDFKIPVSEYTLLMNAGAAIPAPYRAALLTQVGVLMGMLREMDGLSMEMVGYTTEKRYLRDDLQRSDAILDRYAYLFEIFDQKKELLYNDVRRIHESFPNANPKASWFVAGNAMLKTLDDDKEILFGLKRYLKYEASHIPAIATLDEGAKQLIADEYQNLKGLPRYGRSNGLCPYSPYEDLAANSLRFGEKALKVGIVAAGATPHPYESFYYFYNNELVYQYNKFIELSKAGLLSAVNQPDVFAFRRISPKRPDIYQPERNYTGSSGRLPKAEPTDKTLPKTEDSTWEQPANPTNTGQQNKTQIKHDTIYVERVKTDTVYLERSARQAEVTRTLNGFAPNNMVLLLDVSASMNSPYKLPLLKRSIKAMLTLLRPEDQISIVLYSGKARVVLKPTSGTKAAEISRMIDLLQSDGDTDGNEGIKLAYKTANKQFIRGGNNRIILATDGEFPISQEVLRMIETNARQDLYLTVFTFGKYAHNGQKLRKLGELGKGTYAHVTDESADLQLILEAQARKQAQ